MKKVYVNFETGMIERYYRGARTVRFMSLMRPESVVRFRHELHDLLDSGYVATWVHRNGWLYTKGATV